MLPHFSVGWYKDTPRRGLATVDDLVDTEAEVSVARTTDVFPQSIASGGPTPTGVVLWTRIALDHYDPSETLRVKVAPDPSMDDPVVRAELPGPGVEATDNYTVRVDVDGFHEPDSVYYYRFGTGGMPSRTGRRAGR